MRRSVVRAKFSCGFFGALVVAGCTSGPPPVPEPQLRSQAQELAVQGARRYAQADYPAAQRHFEQALRLCVAMDDVACADRQRLNVAQSLAAQGREGEALVPLGQVHDAALGVEAGLLEAQLRLATAQPARAQELLVGLKDRCLGAGGPLAGRWWLLDARAAWSRQDLVATQKAARLALAAFDDPAQAREAANAWRLLAAAQLQAGSPGDAIVSAQAALAQDRQLALPEKIANDWLLIGAAQKASAPDAARQSYRRALDVAQAAGLASLADAARTALTEVSP